MPMSTIRKNHPNEVNKDNKIRPGHGQEGSQGPINLQLICDNAEKAAPNGTHHADMDNHPNPSHVPPSLQIIRN